MSALERLNIEPIIEPFSLEYSSNQNQTKDAFAFKWSKRETYESEEVQEKARQWLLERYCDHDPNKINHWLFDGRKLILDAGCGSGFSAIALFGDHLRNHDYLGVDISDAVDVAQIRFQERGYPGDFLKADLMNLPIPDQSVDIIFSEGVLHHTDNTEKAINYLAQKLKTGGVFLFYVYGKKAEIREFTDDFIRDKLASMTDEDAWEALKPLTQLGIALGKLGVELDVPEDIPFLGIKKGKTDLQRFFYWNIFKAYYRSEFSFDEMNHINFDWYRPLNCQRHTPEEILSYCNSASLKVDWVNVQDSGITVIAQRI